MGSKNGTTDFLVSRVKSCTDLALMVLGVMLMSTSVLVQGPFVTSSWTARYSSLSLVFDSGCLIPCLSFLVISVTFFVFNVVLWFCRCFVLFGFVLPPIQSRTDLFCHVFQNNKNSSSILKFNDCCWKSSTDILPQKWWIFIVLKNMTKQIGSTLNRGQHKTK